MFILLVIVILILLLILSPIGEMLERRDFNNGRCPHCGTSLRCFDTDSQGGRGYTCDKCNYTTWVSYKRVDKNYYHF